MIRKNSFKKRVLVTNQTKKIELVINYQDACIKVHWRHL